MLFKKLIWGASFLCSENSLIWAGSMLITTAFFTSTKTRPRHILLKMRLLEFYCMWQVKLH